MSCEVRTAAGLDDHDCPNERPDALVAFGCLCGALVCLKHHQMLVDCDGVDHPSSLLTFDPIQEETDQ